MKLSPAFCLAIIFSLTILASCSALRTGSPVKAGYDTQKAGFDAEEEGWASRNIPGVKTLSNFVPPPNEARTKWDDWQKRRQRPWNSENSFN
jgi:hypothetical protein